MSSPNNLHVAIEEIVSEVSTSPKVEQVHDVFFLIIKIVGRVWVRLHHLELEQLLEA